MRIGIIQGRLSRPIEGFQECPVNWQQEFSLLPELNLNHIEWIVTKKSFGTNPIFTDDVSRYPISSICADNLVDERIIDKEYLYNKTYREQLKQYLLTKLDNQACSFLR